MRCALLLLAACTCRSSVVPSDSDDSAVDGITVDAGVLRLGPPAPAVGIYDIVAHPEGGKLYLSNLHVPFVTVLDTATGAWSDALDLRDQGQEYTSFQHLFVADGVLLATDQDKQALLRWSLEDHSVLEPISLDAPFMAGLTSDEGLWIALPDRLLRYQDDAVVEQLPLPFAVQAFDVDDQRVAMLSLDTGELLLTARDGSPLWQVELEETWLNDLLLVGEQVWVTDRESGDVIVFEDGLVLDRRHLGSDTFALVRHGDAVLATCRQGAELPASGAYEGAPGTVIALDQDLEPLWELETDKTIHFLAWDGELWWVAAEDALRVVAIDADAGEVALRGPRVGLTLDHLEQQGARLFIPSHLTDELLVVDQGDEPALGSVPSCGWPLVSALHGGELTVICQETAGLQRLDPDSLDELALDVLATTFHPPCDAGLCTGHDVLVDLSEHDGAMVLTDPALPGVRWDDGRQALPLTMPSERMEGLQHMGVRELGGALLVYEPRSATLLSVVDGEIAGSRAISEPVHDEPLVVDGARAWVGRSAVDEALEVVASLPEGSRVALATASWVVALEGTDLVVYDSSDLAERARLSVDALRSPPLVHDRTQDSRGPLRLHEAATDILLVANTFRGTLEYRTLPGLEPLGSDEVLPLGAWADLPGLR
jgi:hypothetical protein